ncbi:MAG TPA: hypothetical protein VGY31_04805 [Terriglobia bacterium]|nr:hypothetical protein [Terriglobia bacterium]
MDLLSDYEGRSIRFTEERWSHIAQHPEMTGIRGVVEETLRDPEAVVESLSDPSARLYYRYYQPTMVGGKYLCTVVKLTGVDAFVITSYLTDRVKGGKVLWPKES